MIRTIPIWVSGTNPGVFLADFDPPLAPDEVEIPVYYPVRDLPSPVLTSVDLVALEDLLSGIRPKP